MDGLGAARSANTGNDCHARQQQSRVTDGKSGSCACGNPATLVHNTTMVLIATYASNFSGYYTLKFAAYSD